MKKLTLTPSQKHSALAGAVVLAAQIANNAPAIISAFPGIHWLTQALTVFGLGVTMLSRSLKTDKSGTGTGVINGGPDTTAQEAQAADAQQVAQAARSAAEAGAESAVNALPPKAVSDAAATIQLVHALWPNAAPFPDLSPVWNSQLAAAKNSLTAHAEALKAEIASTPLNLSMTQLRMSAQDIADGHKAISEAAKTEPALTEAQDSKPSLLQGVMARITGTGAGDTSAETTP